MTRPVWLLLAFVSVARAAPDLHLVTPADVARAQPVEKVDGSLIVDSRLRDVTLPNLRTVGGDISAERGKVVEPPSIRLHLPVLVEVKGEILVLRRASARTTSDLDAPRLARIGGLRVEDVRVVLPALVHGGSRIWIAGPHLDVDLRSLVEAQRIQITNTEDDRSVRLDHLVTCDELFVSVEKTGQIVLPELRHVGALALQVDLGPSASALSLPKLESVDGDAWLTAVYTDLDLPRLTRVGGSFHPCPLRVDAPLLAHVGTLEVCPVAPTTVRFPKLEPR
jgi:hypothetical protein